jgi:hypothetical protein
VGQELLIYSNIPHYLALDWFVFLGFVKPERWTEWQKVDVALPRIQQDGPFGAAGLCCHLCPSVIPLGIANNTSIIITISN